LFVQFKTPASNIRGKTGEHVIILRLVKGILGAI